MEMETIQNYIANSQNLDGLKAEEIKKALEADVPTELGHAQSLAKRVRTLGGRIPGSKEFKAAQTTLQPPADSTDIVTVINGVIDAENGAIKQYKKIIDMADGVDYPTQDLCVRLLSDEEEHCREFEGFLKEFSAKKKK